MAEPNGRPPPARERQMLRDGSAAVSENENKQNMLLVAAQTELSQPH